MRKKSTTATSDQDVPITQADIDSGRLVLRKRTVGGEVLRQKKRVTLYLDAGIVDRFKELAGDRGYQTLINDKLRSVIDQDLLEKTLRRVIREELKGKKAA